MPKTREKQNQLVSWASVVYPAMWSLVFEMVFSCFMYACLYACIYICAWVHARLCVCVCVCVNAHMCPNACVKVREQFLWISYLRYLLSCEFWGLNSGHLVCVHKHNYWLSHLFVFNWTDPPPSLLSKYFLILLYIKGWSSSGEEVGRSPLLTSRTLQTWDQTAK